MLINSSWKYVIQSRVLINMLINVIYTNSKLLINFSHSKKIEKFVNPKMTYELFLDNNSIRSNIQVKKRREWEMQQREDNFLEFSFEKKWMLYTAEELFN